MENFVQAAERQVNLKLECSRVGREIPIGRVCSGIQLPPMKSGADRKAPPRLGLSAGEQRS